MDNLREAFPDKNEQELGEITNGMWDNLGRTTVEGLLIDKFQREASDFELQDDFYDVEGLLKEKGGVVVSLHSGNWELGGVLASQNGHELASVYQRISNPLADAYIRRQRASVFKGGMHVKGENAGRRLMAWVESGKVVAIMADLRESRGIDVDFFGRVAPSSIFPARLARENQVPLLAARFVRVDGLKFKVTMKQIDYPVSDDLQNDLVKTTHLIQHQFEEWIRECPEQWMWAHKRWSNKRRPS